MKASTLRGLGLCEVLEDDFEHLGVLARSALRCCVFSVLVRALRLSITVKK